MRKKNIAIVVFSLIAIVLTFAVAQADSILTSPPSQSGEGVLFIGEDINNNGEQEEVFCVTLKKKKDKVWGPSTPKVKKTNSDKKISGGKYPPIYIKYRTKVYVYPKKAVNTSYKYKKKLSSRHKGKSYSRPKVKRVVKTLNITPIIVREAKKNGISPILLKAVIQTESTFNPYATSYAGAKGLCQLMPRTARLLGVRNPYDPEQSIAGGAKYLGKLKRMFKSQDHFIAAYNAGPGAVRRAGGIPNIYQTRRFVIKVKRNMKKW